MELPHIGEHCSYSECNQLDFLPAKCNMCEKLFCNLHLKYEAHTCPESYKLDVHIPICPLCEQPVPNKPGQSPDLAVNDHLENNCKSKNKKIYNKKCSVSGCRQKEVVSVECSVCTLNFCLKHRHTTDHDCKGPVVAKREKTLNGSIFKNWMKSGSSSGKNEQNSNNREFIPKVTSSNRDIRTCNQIRTSNISSLQGGLSEQEALERAILASTSENGSLPNVSSGTQSSEDEDLAKAIAESLKDQSNNSRNRNKQSSDCSLS